MHKGTVELNKILEESLSKHDYEEVLWKCFTNKHGHPSRKRFNRIFGNLHSDTIKVCKAQEVHAVALLMNISPWALVREYEMGVDGITLMEGNQLLQLEGAELGPVYSLVS